MKYEEQLKDKLEERTIKPSPEAWQKLSDTLDASQSKKSNKGFWYLGIAASIVGVLLITNVFFNNDNANGVEPTIVDVEKTNSKSIDNDNNTEENIAKEKEVFSNDDEVLASENNSKNNEVETPKKQPTQKSVLKQKIVKEQLKLIPNKTVETVVASNVKEEIKEETAKKLSFKDQKALDVVVQIQTMQKTKEVTDAEIDALLNAAQQEITFKRLYNENTKSVDANALLLSVEEDIEEQSFRTRVFEMLKAGYGEVKTIVAERNN